MLSYCRVCQWIGLFAATLLVTGCSPNSVHPVKGQVVWKDSGQPATEIAGSIITFEQAATETSARGQIAADGSFQLTTDRENDGAKLGEHTVLVIEIGRQSLPGGDGSQLAPGKLSTKHASPSTTGIKSVIKPGLNEPKIEIERFMP